MPGITFTPDQIAASAKLDAQWYDCDIVDVTSGPGTKDPTSTTWRIELRVASGPAKGTPVTHFINNASNGALKMTKAFSYIYCFVDKLEPGKEYPIESTKGKKIAAYIQYDMERNDNTVLDFKKMTA